MSKRRRHRVGYGPGNPEFVGIERRTINNSPEWDALKPAAKIFYIHLKARYNGSNNGKIKLPYSAMRGVAGCGSDRAISGAIRELEAKEWIRISRRGGLYRHDNFFTLTFKHDGFK